MPIDTPLHADHQLDQLSGQFEYWRQNRAHPRERIPEHLWDQAVALTSTLSASRVAKYLRLGVSDLKQQINKRQGQLAAPMSTVSGFVEATSEGLTLPPPPARGQGLGSLEVELQRPDGARLRILSPDASLPLAAIVHCFLEA